MNIRNLLAVLAGGAIMFVWSMLSWMALGWHQPTMKVFKNEVAVGQAIKQAAPEPGIYTYPGWTDDVEDMQAKHDAGPYVFASVVPAGVGGEFGTMMLFGFLVDLVGAAFLLFLILSVAVPSWKARMSLSLIAILFISIVPGLMNWNWWHFPIPFVVVGALDSLIGWGLAAAAMAKIVPYPSSGSV